ncbi:MAG TPA: transketolase [Candidatus Saccharimonadia bacterium]|nr:transketolase [Candidatus Saccharimonadia bacterium]
MDSRPTQPYSLQQIAEKAIDIRKDIIEMLLAAGSGHSAGSLGLADVFAALYFRVLQHRPKQPWWDDRDRFVLSAGHVCPVLYASLAEAGYFPKDQLKTLRKFGSKLQGHPIVHELPGIENTSGSLGQGFSVACGMALGAKIRNKDHHIFCVMGDGEQQEGQVWESYWFAGNHRLNNLTVLIDRNNIQSEGFTEDIAPLEPLKAKLEASNWHVLEIDGNNAAAVIGACAEARAILEKPVAIICHTIPGKDVDFMEGNFAWHAKSPDKAQALAALKELRTLKGQLESA